jgi:hypothetical protein
MARRSRKRQGRESSSTESACCLQQIAASSVPWASGRPPGLRAAAFQPYCFEWIGSCWERADCKATKRVARTRLDRISCPGHAPVCQAFHVSRILWEALVPVQGMGSRVFIKMWFCRRCGAFTSHKASRLRLACQPGHQRALPVFRQGVHPRSRQPLSEVRVSSSGLSPPSAEPGSGGRGI